MTLRRSAPAPVNVRDIAAEVPDWLTSHVLDPSFTDPNTYRDWFTALTDEVENITGVHDTGLAMSVALVLGASPSDWFELCLPISGSG